MRKLWSVRLSDHGTLKRTERWQRKKIMVPNTLTSLNHSDPLTFTFHGFTTLPLSFLFSQTILSHTSP